MEKENKIMQSSRFELTVLVLNMPRQKTMIIDEMRALD